MATGPNRWVVTGKSRNDRMRYNFSHRLENGMTWSVPSETNRQPDPLSLTIAQG